MIERQPILTTFRERLREVIDRSGATRSGFAAATGIDRSTLSQLLSPTNRRLPRIETVAELAVSQQVSVDWLLGLSNAGPMAAEIVQDQMSFEHDALSLNDERLLAWFDEARGFKIRNVPSTLPDLLKTDDVIRHELQQSDDTVPEHKIETAAVRLAWARGPENDFECCSSVQAVESFARGEGLFRQLPRAHRIDQLEQMVRLSDELYPTFRWFLYDGLQRYAAPVTVFGAQRAALYLGQMYMVLTSTDHVRTLAKHFDGLVRGAIVQPNEIPTYLASLLDQARR